VKRRVPRKKRLAVLAIEKCFRAAASRGAKSASRIAGDDAVV
jgi:hypothetical protein